MKNSLYSLLQKCEYEKDIERVYKNEFKKILGIEIYSPNNTDGIIEIDRENDTVKSILEFKINKKFEENRNQQLSCILQALYYIKTMELSGKQLPSSIIIGDENEIFIIPTNVVIDVLQNEKIDWSESASTAYLRHPEYLTELENIPNSYIYKIDEDFNLFSICEKIFEIHENNIIKTKIIPQNLHSVYSEYRKVLEKKNKLNTNELVHLFINIVLNDEEVYPNPKRDEITIAGTAYKADKKLFESLENKYSKDFTPVEKETMLAMTDVLLEDESRRENGEFYTPFNRVVEAHNLLCKTFGIDWKEKYVVWDCAWGLGNLTRDYKFSELYCSTLHECDIKTSDSLGINLEAEKFQFDFLNDPYEKIPEKLREHLEGTTGKQIIFLINPPYGAAATNNEKDSKYSKISSGNSKTITSLDMKLSDFGGTRNLYTQFLYRIFCFNSDNHINLGLFSPASILSGNELKKFRSNFFSKFEYTAGFAFPSGEFDGTSSERWWPVLFSIFKSGNGKRVTNFTVSFNETIRNIYNLDDQPGLSNLIKNSDKPVKFPKFTSFNKVKHTNWGSGIPESSFGFGTLSTNANNINESSTAVSILNGGITRNIGKNFINRDNLLDCCVIFCARKSVLPTWINHSDEYKFPNVENPLFEQFKIDSLIYSLFHSNSGQVSLRNLSYDEKQWNIKNEFFWVPKENLMKLSNEYKFDKMYSDIRSDSDRHVSNLLFSTEVNLYSKISGDARSIIDASIKLLENSFELRKSLNAEFPDLQLFCWDAGYAQLKNLWKIYSKEQFQEFRQKYKEFEFRMSELVYELGILER